MRSAPLLLCGVLIACGSEAPPPSTSAPPPPTTASAPPPPTSAPPPTTVAAVDLLHTVATTITVSSAYRDDASQAERLADGNLETAWNSRTGDLETAFVEIALPSAVTVATIGMTAGYTKVSTHGDLFTGNHRIARVRLSRDGIVLGEQDLDPESRAIQPIPVFGGAGGTYRIEIVRVVPGSHPDWRELCISELRVLGAANGAPSATAPVFAVAPVADDTPPSDDEVALDAIEEASEDYFDHWSDYANTLAPAADVAAAERAIDARIEAASPAVQAAIRCDWIDQRLVTHLFRAQRRIDELADAADTMPVQAYDDGTEVVDDSAELEARGDALRALSDAIGHMMDAAFEEHAPRDTLARRMLAADRPAIEELQSDWDALRALATEDAACTPTPLPDGE